MTLLDRTAPAARILGLAGLTLVYVAAGKLGLAMAVVHPSASAVWPPTGIALAALLLLGLGMWPAVLVGAFLVNVTTFGTALTSAGIAVGNTLEALVGAALVRRWAGGLLAFTRTRHAVRFSLLAGGVATAVSATCGVTSLAIAGLAEWPRYGVIWLTWWLGDAAGALVLAPVLVLWSVEPRVRWDRGRVMDGAILVAGLAAVTAVVFARAPGGGAGGPAYPLDFLAIPLVLWAAFQFGARGTVLTVLALSVVAVAATLRGLGPFARPSANESLLLLQAFTAVVAAMGLIVAAAVAERRRAETHLRELAVSDALTGLANYRQLMLVLETEIRRSQRTDRPFALLFLDLDGLKEINDRYGHLVGSEALCRVALVLRHSCRAVDTAARFGGDEFAVVLPEADQAAARRLAARVSARLARQAERPAISVSTGVALYPRDGATAEALLRHADRRLYARKSRSRDG